MTRSFWLNDDEPEEEQEPAKEKPPAEPSFSPIDQALFKSRSILIFGEINQRLAREVTARLLALTHDSQEPIRVFINSQGGHVESGDTIHDMIKFVGPLVQVIGTGWVASAGAHIYLAAQRESRFCLPNTRFLLHQPSGGVRGPAVDIGIEAKEIVKMRQRLNRVIAAETGQPLEKVEKDTDRNFWMSAEEAQAYGIVHRIIGSIGEL